MNTVELKLLMFSLTSNHPYKGNVMCFSMVSPAVASYCEV